MKNKLIKNKTLRIIFQKLYYQLYQRNIYALTGPIRSLPNFIIIGTARSGSTSLYYNICKHPCVLSAAYDELGFFDSNFHLGLNWYRSLFPTIFSKWVVKLLHKKSITGEDTPFYIWSPIVAKRILKILPNVKLIIIFRNPVDRAYSNYHLGVRAGTENQSFEDAIKDELKRLKEPITSKDDISKFTIPSSYVVKGFYAEQLEIWFKLFERKQIFITSTEIFESKPQETLNKIHNFLELPKNQAFSIEKHKVASYPKMNSETRKFLLKLYEKHNSKLFKMINQEFDWNN